jgi:hypothetical protein
VTGQEKKKVENNSYFSLNIPKVQTINEKLGFREQT